MITQATHTRYKNNLEQSRKPVEVVFALLEAHGRRPAYNVVPEPSDDVNGYRGTDNGIDLFCWFNGKKASIDVKLNNAWKTEPPAIQRLGKCNVIEKHGLNDLYCFVGYDLRRFGWLVYPRLDMFTVNPFTWPDGITAPSYEVRPYQLQLRYLCNQ